MYYVFACRLANIHLPTCLPVWRDLDARGIVAVAVAVVAGRSPARAQILRGGGMARSGEGATHVFGAGHGGNETEPDQTRPDQTQQSV